MTSGPLDELVERVVFRPLTGLVDLTGRLREPGYVDGKLATYRLGRSLKSTLASAVLLTVLSWAVFVKGLGLTIPIWPSFLG